MSKNDCVSREDALRYAESIRQYLNELYNDGWLGISDADWRALMEIILRVGDIPPADVKPVVRGEWINRDAAFTECSTCKALYLKQIDTELGKAHWVNPNFCPNCGADMRKEGNNGEKLF